MLVVPSPNYDPTDKTIVFRFNYTETRELYEIKKFSTGKATTDYPALTSISSFYDSKTNLANSAATSCNFGEWLHDNIT